MQKIFFIFLAVFFNSYTTIVTIKFDNNFSNEYKKEIATFIDQNFNKPSFKTNLQEKFKEIKKFKIIKKIKVNIIKINSYEPILTINNEYVLTSKTVSPIENYKIENAHNIKVKNFDPNNKKLINFLHKLEPYVLSKYSVTVENSEKVILEDKKYKDFLVTCSAQTIKPEIIKVCKDIQKEKLKNKKNKKKINADIRFKDQIIISYC